MNPFRDQSKYQIKGFHPDLDSKVLLFDEVYDKNEAINSLKEYFDLYPGWSLWIENNGVRINKYCVYSICGKYKNSEKEVIDKTNTKSDAEYLLNEYRLAFGKDWILWIENK